MAELTLEPNKEHVLYNEAGKEIRFRGKLSSKESYYNADEDSIVNLSLFIADDGRLVYSIVSASSAAKWRRVYTIRLDGEFCLVDNGLQEITLPTEMLLTSVAGLCGIECMGADVRSFLEDARKIVNG